MFLDGLVSRKADAPRPRAGHESFVAACAYMRAYVVRIVCVWLECIDPDDGLDRSPQVILYAASCMRSIALVVTIVDALTFPRCVVTNNKSM
jgi:hypothetical protein